MYMVIETLVAMVLLVATVVTMVGITVDTMVVAMCPFE